MYTILTSSFEIIDRGLNALEVVYAALTYDGGSYEIKKDEYGMWYLYHRYSGRMTECRGWTYVVEASNIFEAERKFFFKAFEQGLPGARIHFLRDEDLETKGE